LKIDKTPDSIMVGDYNTKELIDAERASWVIGGKKMGVMTSRAKWAFGDQQSAQDFISQSGGEEARFSAAIEAAFTDMYQDIQMIRKKRAMKRQGR
jgi:nitrous oxide reductase accessory protein NosL